MSGMFSQNITTAQAANLDAAISSRSAPEVVDEGGIATATTGVGQGTLGAYLQIIAATAHTVRALEISCAPNGIAFFRVAISTGAGGSEVVKKQIRLANTTAVGAGPPIRYPLDPSVIPKGVRVAVAIANDAAAGGQATSVAVTLEEAND